MNKSQMLQDMILNEVRAGRYRPGEPIPSRNQLCRKYNCSRNTVERAITALKQKGSLVSNQGGTTRVAAPPEVQTPGMPAKLFVVSGGMTHEYSDRSIRELFFPDLESSIDVRVIRESTLLRYMDIVAHPGAAVIWVMPEIASLWAMRHLDHSGVPQLLINRNYPNCNYAATDTAASIREGMIWLRETAGTDCAMISGCADLSMPYLADRLIAFYESSAALSIPLSPERLHVFPVRDLPAQVSETGRDLFASGRPPRGIVVLDSRLTVPLVTIGHMYGMTPGRDYFLLTFDYHPELDKYSGIGMLRQQYGKLYLESQRWLCEGYARRGELFRSAIPAELVFGAGSAAKTITAAYQNPACPC